MDNIGWKSLISTTTVDDNIRMYNYLKCKAILLSTFCGTIISIVWSRKSVMVKLQSLHDQWKTMAFILILT